MFRSITKKSIPPYAYATAAAFALGLTFGLTLSAAAATPDARAAFYERSATLALDDRCKILNPGARAALLTAAYQAKGALIRSGVEAAILAGDARRASKRAQTIDCKGADASLIAGRVNSSFAAWSTLQNMDFPGTDRAWQAQRNPLDGWMVSQNLGYGARFGVKLLKDESIATALELPTGAPAPSSARLVLRDPGRAPVAVLLKDASNTSGDKGLAGRLPPPGATRAFYASGRFAPAAATKTRPATGRMFHFPKAALDALSGLDPREAASIVLEYDTPAQTKIMLIEAGDLPAALAFVAPQSASY